MIELGAGYSGLASLVLARYFVKHQYPIDITITDGLDICVESNILIELDSNFEGIKENLELNPELSKHFDVTGGNVDSENPVKPALGQISVQKVVWSKEIISQAKYDVIILSDW